MIAVLGAGAMGSALATHLSRNGEHVILFGTDYDGAALQAWRDGLPHPALGVTLPPDLPIRDLIQSRAALAEAEIIAVAISSAGLRSVLSQVADWAARDAIWVLVTKGWQAETLQSPSEMAASMLGEEARLVTLAGPGIASEIMIGSPTALLCASRDASARRRVAHALEAQTMLTVTTSDVVGAETASAYKNVVAIAVGIAEGLSERFIESAIVRSFANARGAMFAQGMVDMFHLTEARGGHASTIIGLAGSGDLYVTCVGGRNGRFGQLLGSGFTTERALRTINSTVEGVANTEAALRLAARYALDLPTARAVDLALHSRLTGEQGMQLMRELFTATMRQRTTVAR